MRTFKCGACGHTVYFGNVQCLNCGNLLGFNPDRMDMVALAPGPDKLLHDVKRPTGAAVAYCANEAHGVCNWVVRAGAGSGLCRACELNRTIPNLADPRNVRAWGHFERAKKRLIYSLLRFGLPIEDTGNGKGPLAFDFISDAVTGHLDGLITIALGEADAVERERQRQAMEETYRSLLGHLRHESGHYYWMLLIEGTPYIDEFRRIFGDEREDYRAALQRHHEQGPPADWPLQNVSAYASSHPWEDWAETWAHYLHMVDALETAVAMKIEPRGGRFAGGVRTFRARDVYRNESFATLLQRWVPLTLALNEINRSMGHNDFYPFVIPEVAETKLGFVHRVIRECTRKD